MCRRDCTRLYNSPVQAGAPGRAASAGWNPEIAETTSIEPSCARCSNRIDRPGRRAKRPPAIGWVHVTAGGAPVLTAAGPNRSSAGPPIASRSTTPSADARARTSPHVVRSTSGQYTLESIRAPSPPIGIAGSANRARCADEIEPSAERSSTDSHPQ